MKILILSDLHIGNDYYKDYCGVNKYKRILENNIKDDYEVVLISGDVFEHSIMHAKINPYKILGKLFNDKQVIFCLGNHEFAYEDYDEVIKYWQKLENENKNGKIHCLDVCDFFNINDEYIVIGNVLWYDFSLNKNTLLMKGDIVEWWLDSTIKNFDVIKENEKCKNKIIEQINKNIEKKKILLTHMVTNWQLNSFCIDNEFSLYNAYSGIYDFLKDIKEKNIKYSICGHTHRHECKNIYDIYCINIGNDYYFRTNKIENIIIDI